MTMVRASKLGNSYCIECIGHATGDDPAVCAAISAIIYTIAGYITNEASIDAVAVELDSGDARLEFEGGVKAETVFDIGVIGLKQLELSFPSYLIFEKTE